MWWKTITRSPTRNSVTLSPAATTTPVVSWPKIRGAEWEPVAIFFRSVPQMPQVWTRTSISPGPILGTGIVSIRTSLAPLLGKIQAQQLDGVALFELIQAVVVVGGIGEKSARRAAEAAINYAQPS